MSRTVLACLLALICVTSCTACTTFGNTYQHKYPHNTTSRLEFTRVDEKGEDDSGICSATAVGESVILSATHCFRETDSEFIFDNQTMTIMDRFDDGNDHVLIVVDYTFSVYAQFGQALVQGDQVYYWGNPTLSDLLRIGYVAGANGDEVLYDVNGMLGDSGSGIFNEDGKLTGVVSIRHVREDNFILMGSFPINFTAEQLKSAGVATRDHDGHRIPWVKEILSTGIHSESHDRIMKEIELREKMEKLMEEDGILDILKMLKGEL